MAGGGKLLIKFVIEQDDLAGNFVTAKRGKLVKVVHHNHFRGDSLCRRCYAAAQSRKHHFLRCARRHAGKFHQRPGFFSAHPVRDNNFFQLYVEPKLAQLGSDILRSKIGLCRSRRSRPDIVCQVGKLVPGIVALEGRFLQLLEFGGKLRRISRRLLKITLGKNETAKKKNKKDGKECFQAAPPEQIALRQKIFRNRQPLYRRDRTDVSLPGEGLEREVGTAQSKPSFSRNRALFKTEL
jgi:hypothetical protein